MAGPAARGEQPLLGDGVPDVIGVSRQREPTPGAPAWRSSRRGRRGRRRLRTAGESSACPGVCRAGPTAPPGRWGAGESRGVRSSAGRFPRTAAPGRIPGRGVVQNPTQQRAGVAMPALGLGGEHGAEAEHLHRLAVDAPAQVVALCGGEQPAARRRGQRA